MVVELGVYAAQSVVEEKTGHFDIVAVSSATGRTSQTNLSAHPGRQASPFRNTDRGRIYVVWCARPRFGWRTEMTQATSKKAAHPPIISSKILGWLVSDHFDTHAGDFEEFYHVLVEERGRRAANWWYRGQMLRLIPDQLFEKTYWGLLMLKSYLLVGMRNLKKNKIPASINIVGLSMAIGSSIALFLFLYGLNMRDSFHENVDNTYLIGHTTDALETLPGMKQKWGTSPVPMGPALAKAYPQIKQAIRFSQQGVSVQGEQLAFKERISFTDPGFFDLFTFPLASGTPSALEMPGTVILSANMAAKYFGEEDPLGKDVAIRFQSGREEVFAVGAVAAPFPVSAGFTFDLLVGYENRLYADLENLEDWNALTATFLDFHDAADAPFIASQLDLMIRPVAIGDESSQILSYFLDSVQNPNWFTAFLIKDRAMQAPRMVETAMFGVLALLMLLVSCFNYITISLGSASRRLREIGIRKSTGAMKRQLVMQFMTENILICFLALVAGVIFAWGVTIPFMNGMVNGPLQIQPGYLGNSSFWVFLIVLLATIGVLSGSYPAFYVSSFQPVEILRGSRTLGEKKGLTRALTTIQFVLTIVTISFATFAWSIDEKLTAGDWGYDPDKIVVFPVLSAKHYTELQQGASQLANVDLLAGAQDHIGANRRRISVFVEGEERKSYYYGVGPGYLVTMGLRATEGRLFDEAFAADDSTSVVINQTFARQMQWDDPIGQSIRVEEQTYSVVGVVEDFLLNPYAGKEEPVMFAVQPSDSFNSLAVRIDRGDRAAVVSSLQTIWETNFPELDYSYYYQSDVFSRDSLKGVSVFMGYVALFALFVSCMGLFGMASQKAAQRMKEVGIRKALGASASHLIFVVNREFLVMLGLATAIATPLCYFSFSNTFLRYAAVDVPQSLTPFIVANLLVFGVAVISLSLQSRQLLKAVPAVVLRTD